MHFKNSYYLIINSFFIFSFCEANLTSEQIAELIRKKNAKMFELSEEGKKIMSKNHDEFIKILNSKNFNQDVIELLHKLSFTNKSAGKPHGFYDLEFGDIILEEFLAADSKALNSQIEFNNTSKKYENLPENEKKEKIKIANQKYINAAWDAMVAKTAMLMWMQNVLNKSKYS